MNPRFSAFRMVRRRVAGIAAGFVGLGCATVVAAPWTPPDGFVVPATTLSPDGTYGVLAPGWRLVEEGKAPPRNHLVNVKTGQELLVLPGPEWAVWVEDDSGRTVNHLDLKSVWSKDGAVLAWAIDGKWSPATCVLVGVRRGAVVWHADVLRQVQEKMLAATQAAVPENYAAARRRNDGSGAAFPEGFMIAIDLPAAGFTLPWRGHATLDSNVKSIGEEGWPSAANVGATMDFTVDGNGRVAFSKFAIDPALTGVPRQ